MTDPINLFLVFLIGLALGAGVLYAISRAWREQAVAEALSAVKASEASAHAEAKAARERADELYSRIAALNAQLEQRDHAIRDQNILLTEGKAALKEQETLAHRIPALEEELRAKLAVIEQLNREINRLTAGVTEQHTRAEQIPALEAALKEKDAELEKVRADLAKHREDAASFEAKLAHFTHLQDELKKSFTQLASEALQKNNEQFIERAKSEMEKNTITTQAELDKRKQAFEELVKPIKEGLEKYDQKIAQFEIDRSKAYGELVSQLQSAKADSEKLKVETAKLANALRGAPSARGRWGEMELQRVVELAGMKEYVSYDTQVSVEGEDGALRPDMLIHLPERKRIVVDAKVSAKGYFESIDEIDEEKRREKILEHVSQVRVQIANLSGKAYWKQFEQSPEFVVMFMPEPLYLAAVQQDPALMDDAMEKRVVIATPMTLLGLLKIVAFGWRQEQIQDNARQISDLGNKLYNAITVYAGHMEKLKKGLDAAVGAYNSAVGSLERTVLLPARKFKELGAAGGDEIAPAEPLDSATRQIAVPDKKPASPPVLFDS